MGELELVAARWACLWSVFALLRLNKGRGYSECSTDAGWLKQGRCKPLISGTLADLTGF
jgi:hypothetical protein